MGRRRKPKNHKPAINRCLNQIDEELSANVNLLSLGGHVRLENLMELSIKEIEESNYLSHVKNSITGSFGNQLSSIQSFVIYGIGSIISSTISRYQLALIILLKKWLNCSTCLIYDPIMSDEEIEFVQETYGISWIGENERCRRRVTNLQLGEDNCEVREICPKTLFYMPHLDKSLYNNLLWTNWNESCLQELVIIGNSFNEMMLHTPSRIISSNYKYIYFSIQLELLQEKQFVNNFKFTDVFNDIALITFDVSRLKNREMFESLKCKEEPTYNSDDDVL